MPKAKQEVKKEPLSEAEWKEILGAFPGDDRTNTQIRDVLNKIKTEGEVIFTDIESLEERIHRVWEEKSMFFTLDWKAPYRGTDRRFRVRVTRL